MATILLPPDFKDFLRLLNSEAVEYLLVGGYAVGYYGYPRSTGDMDIWVAANPENAQRLARVLRAFGFSAEAAKEQMFLATDQVIQMGVPPLRIDVITGIPGVDFSECYAHKQAALIDDVHVNIISLEHLKHNKKASGRPKDINDLENLPD